MGDGRQQAGGGSRDVAVFHPGVQHSWQTALALQELGRLSFYATSIFYQPDRWPYRIERLLPGPLARRAHAEFRRFAHPALDRSLVHSFGALEWLERIARRAGLERAARQLDTLGNARFGSGLGALIQAHRPGVLWGYNATALEAFAHGRAIGAHCVLDFTTGHPRAYRAVMAEAEVAYPDFVTGPGFHIPEARIAREDAECAAADRIVVGSAFAAETLRAYVPHPDVADRLRVVPYCHDASLFAEAGPRPDRQGGPVRFLFLGQLSLRKGVNLLLKAFSRLPASAATLTLVGDLQLPVATWGRYADRVRHYPPVARAEVPALLAQADILVMPSYFEGGGIVLFEALAAGCAIIQSPNAAHVATAETGIVLDRLSEDAVHEAMLAFVDDRSRLSAAQAAAPAEARRHSFAAYRDRVGAIVDELAR